MGDTVCHPEERRSFRTVGRGNIDPSADVEMGTSSDNGCCRSHERRRARDDANRCSGGLGRANPCLLRHKYRNPEEREMKRIKRLALGLGVAALMVVAVGCGSGESSTARDTSSSAISVENASGNTVAPQAHNGPDTEPDVVRQDESVALATDMALTANQTGLPVESVEYRNPEEREMKRIKRLALGLGVAALMVVAVGCGSGESSTARDTSSSAISVENASGNTVAPQAHNGPDTEPDVVRQDESVALATDMALTANQTGLPVESVERAIAFQQAFGKYVDELIDRFPDQISAVRTEPIPNTRGHVRFTGKVPPEVTSEIQRPRFERTQP